MSLDRLGVVGAGLIGTSIGLAARRGGGEAPVLVDADPGRAAAAAALGAGRAGDWADLAGCDHVVLAVAPAATASVAAQVVQIALDATLSDVASVKSRLVAEVETVLSDDGPRFCGGHPIAGRERHGPGAAQPELFENAVWVVTPTERTGAGARADALALAELCGARPLVLSPEEHDRVLALVSHAPQLLASVLAGELPDAGRHAAVLAGSGFRDVTRLADSEADLWADITTANAAELAPVLERMAARIAALAAAVGAGDADGVRDAVRAGHRGRALLPAKARNPRPQWARVGVVLADRPGELARLLAAAGEAGVNVEDLAIEHAPEHPVGFVDLEVAPESVPVLLEALTAAGWAAHRTN